MHIHVFHLHGYIPSECRRVCLVGATGTECRREPRAGHNAVQFY